jgi:hypothetical protein
LEILQVIPAWQSPELGTSSQELQLGALQAQGPLSPPPPPPGMLQVLSLERAQALQVQQPLVQVRQPQAQGRHHRQ